MALTLLDKTSLVILEDIMDSLRQRQIIERKIEMYENTLYDAELEAKIADVLEDEQAKENAKRNMKRVMKAIDFLKVQLAELREEEND